jgi:hypothetical protein
MRRHGIIHVEANKNEESLSKYKEGVINMIKM